MYCSSVMLNQLYVIFIVYWWKTVNHGIPHLKSLHFYFSLVAEGLRSYFTETPVRCSSLKGTPIYNLKLKKKGCDPLLFFHSLMI